ncbi:MAG: hypothetical protein AB7N54_15195 [Alphaproteobacteria bacterium]
MQDASGWFNPTIAAALIAAAVAVATFVIRDLVVSSRRSRQSSRARLVEEKLTKIYSPLMAMMGTRDLGDSETLGILHYDQRLRDSVGENLHLLSPSLRDMVTEAISMGRWNGPNQGFTPAEQKRLLEMTPAFRTALMEEFEALRKEHAGE